jgi:hypothetical protein
MFVVKMGEKVVGCTSSRLRADEFCMLRRDLRVESLPDLEPLPGWACPTLERLCAEARARYDPCLRDRSVPLLALMREMTGWDRGGAVAALARLRGVSAEEMASAVEEDLRAARDLGRCPGGDRSCPVCGNANDLFLRVARDRRHRVKCPARGASGPDRGCDEDAIGAWNDLPRSVDRGGCGRDPRLERLAEEPGAVVDRAAEGKGGAP